MAMDLTEAVLYTFLPCSLFLLGLAMCRSCNRQGGPDDVDDSPPEPPQEDPQAISIPMDPVPPPAPSYKEEENPSNPSGLV
jgi:hypothetical protein